MKYHIPIYQDRWVQRTGPHFCGAEQIIVQDFGDGQRLVVELRREHTAETTVQVHDARLEQRTGAAAEAWQRLRKVRRGDLVLVDAG